MNDFIVKRYINTGEYSKEKTLDLINDTKEIIAQNYNQNTINKETANRKTIINSQIYWH